MSVKQVIGEAYKYPVVKNMYGYVVALKDGRVYSVTKKSGTNISYIVAPIMEKNYSNVKEYRKTQLLKEFIVLDISTKEEYKQILLESL